MGFCMALSMNSVGIPGGFRGNAGFSGKFGVWGGFGRFGGQKALAQIATRSPQSPVFPVGYPDKKIYVPWVPKIAQKSLTPRHPTGRLPPPPPDGHRPKKIYVYVMWMQEGFTAEPLRNDSGVNFHDSGFGPKVRVTGQKSELQTKSQSCSRADPRI